MTFPASLVRTNSEGNKYMRKTTLAASVAAIIASQASYAAIDGWEAPSANARLTALNQNYVSINDDYDIWFNPAWVNEYSNRAYGAFGIFNNGGVYDNTTPDLAGANIKTGFGVIGLFFGRNYTGPINFGTIGDGTSVVVDTTTFNLGGTPGSLLVPAAATPDNLFDLFYGTDLGSMAVGVRLNMNRYADSIENPTGAAGGGITINAKNQSVAATDLNFSVGAKMKNMPFDGAVTIGKPMFTSDATTSLDNAGAISSNSEKLEDDGALDFGIVGRGRFMETKKSSIVATARFAMENASLKKTSKTVTAGTTTLDEAGELGDKTMRLDLFGSYHLKPSDDVLVVATTGLQYEKQTATYKFTDALAGVPLQEDQEIVTSGVIIPVAIGVEAKANKNWTLRGSLAKQLWNSNTETGTVKATAGAAPAPEGDIVTKTSDLTSNIVTLALGARYELGKSLMIDGVINKDLLFTGPQIVSGISNTLLTQVSMIYEF